MREAFTGRHEVSVSGDFAFEQGRKNFPVDRTARGFANIQKPRHGVFMAVDQRIKARMQSVKRLVMSRQNQRIAGQFLAQSYATVDPVLQRIGERFSRKQRYI